MVNPLFVRKIVGIIGNVISFGLFLSPLPTFRTIWSRKDVEDYSPMPYLATLMNCAVWVFYGMPFVSESNTLVYTINGIGFLMEVMYLTVFFIFSKFGNRKKMVLVLMAEAAFLAAVVGGVIGGIHLLKTRTYVVGILAVVFGTCMYASPLTIMRLVVTTKSVEYMPFSISVVCFINGICWTAYALLKFDVFVLIPNGLGAILGAVQLVLYACYYNTTPKKGRKPETQMQQQTASVTPDDV